jgi:hypothetical protein
LDFVFYLVHVLEVTEIVDDFAVFRARVYEDLYAYLSFCTLECNGVNVEVTPGGHFLWLQGPKVSCHKHSKLSGTNQSLLSAIDFYVFMFFNLSGYL